MTATDRRAPRISRWLGSTAAAVTLASAVLAPAPAGAQTVPPGPLRTSEQNPLYRLFYVPEAETADVVETGRYRIDVSSSYSNIFELSSSGLHDQIFDLEQMTTGVTLRYGVSPGLEVGTRLGFQTTWGGFLDPVINGFHEAFGLPNGGRERVGDNEYRVLLDGLAPRVRFRLSSRTFGPEDARLFAKWRILGSREESNAVSVRGTFRLATGPVDAGRANGALAVLGRYSADRVHVHAALGGTTLNAPEELSPIVSGAAAFFTVGLEGNLTRRLSLIGQYTGASRYVGGFEDGELDHMAAALAFGFRGVAGSDWTWEFSFAEDVPPDSPTVDFTVDLEVSRSF